MTPSYNLLKARAPGTLMLMGEHAVLQGQSALCAAVNQWMRLEMRPREDRVFKIQSALGSYEGSLDDLEVCKPYTFILQAVQDSQPIRGFDLRIQSDFLSTLGFGSSAAVTVSITALLHAMAGKSFDRAAIFGEALSVIRTVQGRASGSDVAAAVYGGVVHYRAEPLLIEPLQSSFPLSVCYTGYKTPTPEVIRQVEARRRRHPERFAEIFALMGHCVEDAVLAIREGDPKQLGELFDLHHGLQSSLGCSDETLEYLVHQLRGQPGVLGAKISGSGLGDCVIALGNPDAQVHGYEHFSVETAREGVTLER